MTKQEIITKVKELNLPTGSYVVFGSCPMAAAGIRESSDIDFLVSEDMIPKLKKLGWKEQDKGPNDKPLVYDVFEAHSNWDFSTYNPTLEQLLNSADILDGVPFASLNEVRKWKKASGRPKDITDIKLIDEYVKSKDH